MTNDFTPRLEEPTPRGKYAEAIQLAKENPGHWVLAAILTHTGGSTSTEYRKRGMKVTSRKVPNTNTYKLFIMQVAS